MADRNMEILIGLNILRRHHCSIDLKNNVLRFGDGTETPFIGEEEYKREKEIIEKEEGESGGKIFWTKAFSLLDFLLLARMPLFLLLKLFLFYSPGHYLAVPI